MDNLEIVTSTGSDIRGSVRVDGQEPLRDVMLSVQLRTQNETGWGGAGGTVAGDGSFRLEHVHPGIYTLSVTGLPDEYYLKSVRIGQAEFVSAGVDLSQGIPSGVLDITVSAAGGQIHGSVQKANGEPAIGALVELAPEAARSGLFKTATTDQMGQYAVKGITPGAYRLFAWEDIEPGRSEDLDFLKQYEEQGQAIIFRENAREQRTLKLIAAEPAKKQQPRMTPTLPR